MSRSYLLGRGSDGQDSAGLTLLLSRSVKREAPGRFLRKYEQCMYRHIRLSISTVLYGLGAARRINPQLTTAEQELAAGHHRPRPLTLPSALNPRRLHSTQAQYETALVVHKANLQDFRSCSEALSYFLFSTRTEVMARRSMSADYLALNTKTLG